MRPANLGIIIATQIIFIAHASQYQWQNIDLYKSLFVILSTVLTAAGGNVINDIFDIEEDQINNPEKRIIARHISLKNGHVFYYSIAAASIIFGFLAGYTMLALSICIGILLYFYSSDLKGETLWGNLLVAFMTGAVIFASDLGVVTRFAGYFAEYALLAFFITISREIVKDMEDIEGDKAQDYRTYPIVYGTEKSALLAAIFIILIIAEIIYLMIQYGNIFYNTYAALLIIIPAFVLILKIKMAKDVKAHHRNSTYLKLLMVSGMLSVLLLK